MLKILLVLITVTSLISCNRIGSGRTKNLTELSVKLTAEHSAKISLPLSQIKKINTEIPQKNSHRIAKAAISTEPIIVKNIVYSLDRASYVSAYSLKQKKMLWRVNISAHRSDKQIDGGGILHSNGRLYITNGSRYLVVLDVANGEEIIRKKYPDILKTKPIMVSSQLLLAQTVSNQLIAYDLKNSKFTWKHEDENEIISTSNQVGPISFDGFVLASYNSGSIFYLNGTDGSVKWQYNLIESYNTGVAGLEPAVIITKPIIRDEYAYFATSNNRLIKVDLTNGFPVWSKNIEAIQQVSLIGDYLFVTNNARQVAAIDEHDGVVNWVGDLISQQERDNIIIPPIWTQAPFISQEQQKFAINVVASNGELYKFMLSADGKAASNPIIKKISRNIRYIWLSCCRTGFDLITDYRLKY